MRDRIPAAIRLTRKRLPTLLTKAIGGFISDRCTQMAAGISYWVLFSIFPLAIVLVGIAGRFLRDERLQDRIIESLLDFLPLDPFEGQRIIEDVIKGVTGDFNVVTLVSLVGLLWGASAMMTSIRMSINAAWGHGLRRPPVLGKLIDIIMVFALGAVVLLSVVVTGLLRIGSSVVESLPLVTPGWSWTMISLVAPFVVTFLMLTLLYRFVVAIPVRLADIWPGVLIATIGFEVVRQGFAFYIANFGNINAIYGSIGAIIAFLMFVHFSAMTLLFGAEVASEWPRVRAGYYDAPAESEQDGAHDKDDRTTFQRLRALAVSLIIMDEHVREEHTRRIIPVDDNDDSG